MAYTHNRSNTQAQPQQGYQRPAAPAAASSDRPKSTSISVAGLYEGKAGSKLAMKSGTLKEAITIPAGYQLKVFVKGGKSKNGKDLPPFEVVAQPALKRD